MEKRRRSSLRLLNEPEPAAVEMQTWRLRRQHFFFRFFLLQTHSHGGQQQHLGFGLGRWHLGFGFGQQAWRETLSPSSSSPRARRREPDVASTGPRRRLRDRARFNASTSSTSSSSRSETCARIHSRRNNVTSCFFEDISNSMIAIGLYRLYTYPMRKLYLIHAILFHRTIKLLQLSL